MSDDPIACKLFHNIEFPESKVNLIYLSLLDNLKTEYKFLLSYLNLYISLIPASNLIGDLNILPSISLNDEAPFFLVIYFERKWVNLCCDQKAEDYYKWFHIFNILIIKSIIN